jgi:hypothetical protein
MWAVVAALSCTVIIAVPAARTVLGTPEITPVVWLMVNPGGSPAAENVYVPTPPITPTRTLILGIAVSTEELGMLNRGLWMNCNGAAAVTAP